jgi:hypothetical protein
MTWHGGVDRWPPGPGACRGAKHGRSGRPDLQRWVHRQPPAGTSHVHTGGGGDRRSWWRLVAIVGHPAAAVSGSTVAGIGKPGTARPGKEEP